MLGLRQHRQSHHYGLLVCNTMPTKQGINTCMCMACAATVATEKTTRSPGSTPSRLLSRSRYSQQFHSAQRTGWVVPRGCKRGMSRIANVTQARQNDNTIALHAWKGACVTKVSLCTPHWPCESQDVHCAVKHVQFFFPSTPHTRIAHTHVNL